MEYFVSLSETGRIVILKGIRDNLNIKKGDFLLIQKKEPGFLAVYTEDKIPDKIKNEFDMIERIFKERFRVRTPSLNYKRVENNYRIFIPRSCRIFSSIENFRYSKKKKVLLILRSQEYFEIWSKEYYNLLFKKVLDGMKKGEKKY
ncbi:MAG: AbrB/MazE/SpoVT family DNA-binding domain-containing protein [Flavobacteriaceae bacterium]|nr:AbrB/MazE/SpoVT family DNA-binding domain-containing protein [Flavobacteriaceae bacterium]